MKISISMPDEVYEEVVREAGLQERTVSAEILFRVKRYKLGGSQVMVGENRVDIIDKVGTMPSTNIDKIEDTNYEQVISAIERINDPDYQSDSEEISEVRRMVREAGLSYNEKSKALWKQDGEKWKLIKQF